MARNLLPSLRSGGLAERGLGLDPLFAAQREMNRLFDDLFGGIAVPMLRDQEGGSMGNLLMPRMDVTETDNELRLKVDMPGVAAEDVEVMLNDDVLTIRGEKKVERKEDRENAHLIERSFGTFQRSLRLPFRVSADEVKANFDNGVLTVTVPKPSGEGRSNRVSVQSGGQQGTQSAQSGQGSQGNGQGASTSQAA
jgi:HSP20 family protein